MTATEDLRRMLDERGVEYEVDDTQVDGNGTMYRVTYVKDGYGRTWVYENPPDCDLLVSYNHDLGAEDAIAATLGSCNCSNSERTGTCTADETEHIDISWQDGRHLTIHVMECTECGHTYEHVNGDYEYCPRCGRKRRDFVE